VTVPKATVNKDDFSQSRKYYVGGTRQIAAVKPEAVAEAVCDTANNLFRLCVLSPD
jgi:hypothetical protein